MHTISPSRPQSEIMTATLLIASLDTCQERVKGIIDLFPTISYTDMETLKILPRATLILSN